ncbi:uncharacterized protein SAZU_6253 [Streptomyces azureus]|uniref:Uncharacterized protein n=1 Tax=Streptomyces azureus TaxID=146537 RepID=A0A0K8PUC4_STRAJ|nr:uncharacterized protein SAZU_6253 [Streptomyces azureus]
MEAVGAGAEGGAEFRDGHVALPVAVGGEDGPQFAAEVGTVLGLVRQQRADPGRDLHGGGQLAFTRAGIVVEQPDVAVNHAPVADRQADPAPVHPGLRRRRDTDRAGRTRDAEALEPRPDGRRGAAGEDRAGAHRVQGRRIEIALTVVRAEGDQLEVPVLQRRGRPEQLRDLVDQFLVVTPVFRRHPGIVPHFTGPFIHLSEICGTDA